MKRFLLLKIFLLIIIQTSVFGTTYYVSKSGNDSYIGSKDYPWKTLKKGFDSLRASDTLLIRGGTYYPIEILYPGVKNGASNESERITIKNYPHETVWIDGTNIIFTKPDTTYIEGVISISNYRNFITINGINIINSKSMGIAVWYYAKYATIKNCHIKHMQSSGIFISGGEGSIIHNNEIEEYTYLGNHEGLSIMNANHVTISNNYIHNIGNEDGHHNGIAIDIKNGGSGHRIYGNRIHNSAIVGIYVDSRGEVTDLEIYNNYIYNVGDTHATGTGIVLTDEKPELGNVLNGCKIYNNIIIDQYIRGISLGWSGIPGNPIQNVEIVNNTIYGNSRAGIELATTSGPYKHAKNITIANNILSGNGNQILKYSDNIYFKEYTIDNNLLFGTNDLVGTNAILGDPSFKNVANYDFRINAESPAINNGSAKYFVPSMDFDGNIRNNGSGITIGAFEYMESDNANNHVLGIPEDLLILLPDSIQ